MSDRARAIALHSLARLPASIPLDDDSDPAPSGVRSRVDSPRDAPPRSEPSAPRVRLIDTHDVGEARRLFRGLYGDSTLEPQLGVPFAWTLDVVRSGPVCFAEGSWPGGGRAVALAIAERYILSFSRMTGAGGQQAGQPFDLVPGQRAVVFSPGQSAAIHVETGHLAQTVTIERGALDAHFHLLTGRQLGAPLLFDVTLNLEHRPGAAVHTTVELFRREAERPGASPLWLAGLRDAFFTGLLTNTRHSASGILDAPPARIAPASVRRAEEYIAAHTAEAIALADIVRAAGVPARSLRAAFAAARGLGPMAFLRQRRIDLARRWLIEAVPGATVAGVVAALGLGGAGRFSVEYRNRFGESPSATLAHGRAGAGATALRRARGK